MRNNLKVVGFSTALNVILLMVLLTFVGYMVDSSKFGSAATSLVGSFSSSNPAAGSTGQVASLLSNINIVFAVLGIGSIAVGVLSAFTIGFPNPYVIFAPFAYFTLGFLVFPINLFNADSGLPTEIRAMLIFIISLIMLFAVYDLARQR